LSGNRTIEILEGVPDIYSSLFDIHEATGYLHSSAVLVTNKQGTDFVSNAF